MCMTQLKPLRWLCSQLSSAEGAERNRRRRAAVPLIVAVNMYFGGDVFQKRHRAPCCTDQSQQRFIAVIIGMI